MKVPLQHFADVDLQEHLRAIADVRSTASLGRP